MKATMSNMFTFRSASSICYISLLRGWVHQITILQDSFYAAEECGDIDSTEFYQDHPRIFLGVKKLILTNIGILTQKYILFRLQLEFIRQFRYIVRCTTICWNHSNRFYPFLLFLYSTVSCNNALGFHSGQTRRFRNKLKSISSVLSIMHFRKFFSDMLGVLK